MNNLIRIITLIPLLGFIFISPLSAREYSSRIGSTHSISLKTLYRLEYSYEYKWNSGMSIIGRIGAGSEIFRRSKDYVIGQGFSIEVEPRYYLNVADFFSVKVNGAVLVPNTPFDASLVPVYGLRRDFSRRWFCEFTVGGGIGYYSGSGGSLYFEPHIQFRIGLKL